MGQGNIIFEFKQINKLFGPTIALKNVDIKLRKGEIRGLIGENGSGKSTVMSIASGMQKATSGEMFFMGEKWAPSSMIEAQREGISMILQEANTISGSTVAQNIFAGREKLFHKGGIMHMRSMYKKADELLKKFEINHIQSRDYIDRYNFEDRKLIELVRCIDEDTKILVVDETTTALSHEGREILYNIMHKMANEGKSVVFISHDMEEIIEHCSVLTVLRDGDIVGELSKEEMLATESRKIIRNLMVGREIGEKYYREDYDISHQEEVALELKNITFENIENFSLTLHKGEIIGFGGLSGCGMHEIGRAAYGLSKIKQGKVIRNGKEIKNTLQAIESGIGYISKNRDTEAIILEAAIQDNIVLPSLKTLGKGIVVSPAKENKMASTEIDRFRIKCNNSKQWVKTLSGGNKQKVSFAKWTAKDSEVIIMDCPTRGVDVGVKQSMYEMIENMKREGKAIIIISEELTELIGMVDKLIIMKNYKVTKEFLRSPDLKQTDIIEYMI